MFRAVLKKVRQFFKKKGSCPRPIDEGSTNLSPNEAAAEGLMSRSSSTRSSVRSKPPSVPPTDAAPGWAKSGSFERSEDRPSSPHRMSESPSMPPVSMPQLPTILVGEVMEPIGLGGHTRADSEHHPRDEFLMEQEAIAA